MQRPNFEVIGPDLIDVWTWSLDAPPSSVEEFAALLSAEELARAQRFVRERDGQRFIVGRGRLRSILGQYLGLPPQNVRFAYNDYGKPAVALSGGTPFHFNLSHSADLAALAISDHYELGIDIEEIRFLKEDIAGRFFSHKECLTLRALPPEAYLEGFYRCWTRKEAFVKAHGEGLSLALDSFDVTFDWANEPRLERLDGDPEAPFNWRILEVETPVTFAGAVLALTKGRPVSLRYRSNEDETPKAHCDLRDSRQAL
ncbi:4'-phosphopantetheinyl transferase family protein [Rhizobium leucaenae]|uniref:4'-phosphopantetheinyl transferase n=1 Tax=Rhizobium leucaenae TaxID=29450 RepID=A0A7W6ZR41_9HYPH|nr:4'-phosphopantetheinyl transferase superfamily protein [Rhizobium leucaenae]MBB4567172.1 4'-phosphopantetheinyl transferase [Rhizobium leucaenae]MBB6304590.1 4'-phosphopantetheinyl transferase [Rhizobium leucaenae]